jgi:hypothetical protein
MLRALLLAGLLLAAPSASQDAAPEQPEDARQIHWQRSLEDALALAAATGRPLLVAINTDAESASERIVREVYRDPSFVAHTRAFVCVLASPFRHTPRDHDGRGRRVVDPRFGEITSGEAVLLEPVLFERYLGGQRIAPRHALIRADGSAVFDLFQLYDFGVLERALAEQAALAGGAVELEAAQAQTLAAEPQGRAPQWAALAAARSARNRAHFEDLLARVPAPQLSEALAAIEVHGNAGSLDALRVILARAPREGEVFQAALERCARARELAGPLAYVLWEQLLRIDARPCEPGLAREALLLPLLGRLQPELARMQPTDALPAPRVSAGGLRSFLISYAAIGAVGPGLEREQVQRALAAGLEESELTAMNLALAAEGGPCDGASLLRYARNARPPARPAVPAESLRSESELAVALEELERMPATERSTPQTRLQRARTALELARVRLAAAAGGADLLLEDALADFAAAGEALPEDAGLRLEAARAAFLLGRFEDQERLALSALAILDRTAPPPDALHETDWEWLVPADDQRTEALRWLGDAAARRIAARAGAAPREEALGLLRAGRALSLVAAGAESDATDWVSLASFYGAIGRRREELAAAREGLARHPASDELRAALRRVATLAGRPELALEVARELAGEHPDDAGVAWHLGYANLEDAERLRRAEDPRGALQRYAEADDAWLRSVELQPNFASGVAQYRARVELGQGFAHLLAEDRVSAAEELVRAVATSPSIAGLRDSLDREALDLLDGVLEARASGPSPVDALALGERLAAADIAGAASWLAAVADSELREALRAAGRGAPDADVDDYLARAAAAARRALEHAAGEAVAVRSLAQALVISAERALARDELDVAELRRWLTEAAGLVGSDPPGQEADREALEALARGLRSALGEAAPITRPGR